MSTRLLLPLAVLAALALAVLTVARWPADDDPGGLAPDAPAAVARPADGGSPSLFSTASVAGAPARAPARAPRDAGPDAEPDTFAWAVTGRFVDRRGAPLGGVLLAASPASALARGAGTESADDGRFRLEHAFPVADAGRVLTLVATADSFARHHIRRTLAAGAADLGDIVLTAPGGVSGRVVDADGLGFAGAEVLATRARAIPIHAQRAERPRDALATTTSGPNGEFVLEELAEGDTRIWAGAQGMLWAYADGLRVRAGEETRGLVLRLEALDPGHAIAMLVLDPEGEPVPNARLEYLYHQGGHSGSGDAHADERGHYEHLLRHLAPHDFAAFDPEGRYRPATARAVEPGTTDLVLQLGAPRLLEIVATAANGARLDAFDVSSRTVVGERWLTGDSAFQRTEAGAATGPCSMQLPVEPFELTVEAAGYLRDVQGPFDPERVGRVVEFALEPVAGVAGRVIDAHGTPVAGARVGLHAAVGDRSALEVNGFPCRSHQAASAESSTDADGRFLISLQAAGRYYLRATSDGCAPGELGPLDLAPHLATTGLEVALGAGGAIEGELITPGGADLGGRIIGISRADGFARTGRTDAQGRFRFERLTPGPWQVVACNAELSPDSTTTSSSTAPDGPDPLEWSCEVLEGRTTRFDLDLRTAGLVALEGSLAFSGTPPVGWEAVLERTGPDAKTVAHDVLDSQGEFRLELSEPGSYKLSVRGTWKGTTTLVLVHQTIALDAGTHSWREDLPVGRLEVTASLALGEQLVYGWRRGDGLSFGCSLARDGAHYVLPCAPAGTGRLRRAALDATEVEREVVLVEGQTERIEL
jgi:hypothetical protein